MHDLTLSVTEQPDSSPGVTSQVGRAQICAGATAGRGAGDDQLYLHSGLADWPGPPGLWDEPALCPALFRAAGSLEWAVVMISVPFQHPLASIFPSVPQRVLCCCNHRLRALPLHPALQAATQHDVAFGMESTGGVIVDLIAARLDRVTEPVLKAESHDRESETTNKPTTIILSETHYNAHSIVRPI